LKKLSQFDSVVVMMFFKRQFDTALLPMNLISFTPVFSFSLTVNTTSTLPFGNSTMRAETSAWPRPWVR